MSGKIRKCRSVLVYAGIGTMIFAVWSVIKLALLFIFDSEDSQKLLDALEVQQEIRIPIEIATVIFMALGALVFFFVGKAAVREGKGRKRGFGYIVFACVLAAVVLLGIIEEFSTETVRISAYETIGSALIDISSLIALCDIIYYGIRLKTAEKKAHEQGGAADAD